MYIENIMNNIQIEKYKLIKTIARLIFGICITLLLIYFSHEIEKTSLSICALLSALGLFAKDVIPPILDLLHYFGTSLVPSDKEGDN